MLVFHLKLGYSQLLGTGAIVARLQVQLELQVKSFLIEQF